MNGEDCAGAAVDFLSGVVMVVACLTLAGVGVTAERLFAERGVKGDGVVVIY